MEKSYDHLQIGNKVWCLNPMADKKKDPQAPPYICGEITYLDPKSKILEMLIKKFVLLRQCLL